jgi:hypothetical protein
MLYAAAKREIKGRLAADCANFPVMLDIHLRELNSVMERSSHFVIREPSRPFLQGAISPHTQHTV